MKHDENGRPYLICGFCNGKINPATEGWEAAHGVADYFGGKEGFPAHIKCHKHETTTKDIPAIAKSKRASDKHLGIKRKGWGGKYRKKMRGEVIRG